MVLLTESGLRSELCLLRRRIRLRSKQGRGIAKNLPILVARGPWHAPRGVLEHPAIHCGWRNVVCTRLMPPLFSEIPTVIVRGIKRRQPKVPLIAAELIESIKPNEHGWFFPSAKDPKRPVSHGTLYSFMWRQRDRGVIPVVTNRDLRRTWKTLAGQAGVPKEIRDRIQNHALQDVSSKNYDRWNYMREKRAGMAKWDKFVRAMLDKKRPLKLVA